jgi:CheY-like chemotaxis protein
MQRRSGISVLRRLRLETLTKSTRVIVCSSMMSKKGFEQLKNLGVEDFISKTAEPEVLLEKIMSYLNPE